MFSPLLLSSSLLLLLLLTPPDLTQARSLTPPTDSLQLMEQFMERYNDLLTLDDLENLLNLPQEDQSSSLSSSLSSSPPGGARGSSDSPDSPWLRLLRGALSNQKRAEPERGRRGWNRGCFGLKLDRIGSMSGLGC